MVEAASKAVEALSSCLCCLVNSSVKYLKATYVHEGKTEIYVDMLKDCLDIRIDIDSNACGICEECVGRLRDAINFKLQVQRCQVKLHKLITRTVHLLEEEPEFKSELADDDYGDNMNDNLSSGQEEEPEMKPDIAHAENDVSVYLSIKQEEPEVKTEIANDDDDVSDNLSVRQGDEDDVKPETADAGGTGGDSTDHEASLTTHVKDMRHDSLGVRAEAEGGADTASGTGAGHRCGTCGNTFKKKSDLIRHTVVHTGEKPYRCEMCHKRFSRKDHFTNHIRAHTGEKPFSCDVCNKRFAQKEYLINHIRIHKGEKPFSCDVCNKRFTQRGTLRNHITTHSQEKPYSCDVCNKRFTTKQTLTSHSKIHTGRNLSQL